MNNFDDIRPYRDSEVRPTLDRILGDRELSHAVASFKFPRLTKWFPKLVRPCARSILKHQLKQVKDVRSFQDIIEYYMSKMIDTTISEFSCSGLEGLDDKQSYLFVSNHRDIAMDPALVNWALYRFGFDTVRIAIGDNLLTKPYVSDLIRLNKSFIVNRSAVGPKEKFKVLKKLSAYIYHSLNEERESVWIAQREGRAKDGLDRTNNAVVSMFALNRPKPQSLSDYIASLRIVPVSISYEWDPCDTAKAVEIYQQRQLGGYEKAEHEDVASIATGITGQKGRVHITFGKVLSGEFNTKEEVGAALDKQIIGNYLLQPSNVVAYEMLYGRPCDDRKQEAHKNEVRKELERRLAQIDKACGDILLSMYANPVVSKEEFLNRASQADVVVSP